MDATVSIRPRGRGFELRSDQWVPQPRERIFPFFADPSNLELLTPPFLHFHVRRSTTPRVGEATVLTFTLLIHGLPILWRSRVQEWQPPDRFVDVQLVGPYSEWHHTHTFEAAGTGTRLQDIVRYRLPFGPVGHTFLMAWVHRDVRRIFEHRQSVIASLFG